MEEYSTWSLQQHLNTLASLDAKGLPTDIVAMGVTERSASGFHTLTKSRYFSDVSTTLLSSLATRVTKCPLLPSALSLVQIHHFIPTYSPPRILSQGYQCPCQIHFNPDNKKETPKTYAVHIPSYPSPAPALTSFHPFASSSTLISLKFVFLLPTTPPPSWCW